MNEERGKKRGGKKTYEGKRRRTIIRYNEGKEEEPERRGRELVGGR